MNVAFSSSGCDSLTASRRVCVSVIFVTLMESLSPLWKVWHGVFLNTILDQLTALDSMVS